jgi:hypothetical protein
MELNFGGVAFVNICYQGVLFINTKARQTGLGPRVKNAPRQSKTNGEPTTQRGTLQTSGVSI